MSAFGLVVVFAVLWWVVFLALLPVGVERQDAPAAGHDPGAPKRPLLWRKAAAATLIATVLVAVLWLVDERGWIGLRALIYGRGAEGP